MPPRAPNLPFEDLEKIWGDSAVLNLVAMRLVSADIEWRWGWKRRLSLATMTARQPAAVYNIAQEISVCRQSALILFSFAAFWPQWLKIVSKVFVRRQ